MTGLLERLRVSGFVVGQGPVDAVIDASRLRIGLELRVDGLRAVPVQPCVEFFQFGRRERQNGAFNLLDRVLPAPYHWTRVNE